MSAAGRPGRVRRAFRAWLVLVACTALAAWLSRFDTRAWRVLPTLALTVVKGHLIVDVFMDLATAPRAWRTALLAWVWTLGAVIGAVLLV